MVCPEKVDSWAPHNRAFGLLGLAARFWSSCDLETMPKSLFSTVQLDCPEQSIQDWLYGSISFEAWQYCTLHISNTTQRPSELPWHKFCPFPAVSTARHHVYASQIFYNIILLPREDSESLLVSFPFLSFFPFPPPFHIFFLWLSGSLYPLLLL